jgi:putative peptidoglycan lipid II flippase
MDPTNAPADAATQTATRRIAGAAAVVMFFFVLSRLSGLAREIIIGALFGTSADYDAYLAAFRVPDLLFQLIAGGALGSAFIPVFAVYWSNGDRTGAWLLFSRVLNLIVLILAGAACVAAIFAPALVERVIAPGFSPEQQALTASLMRWMLASTVIFAASGLIMAALNAVQHFVLPAAAPVVYNLAIILGAWLLAPSLGVYGLAVGVVAGAIAHLLVQIPGLWIKRARYTASLAIRDRGVREVGRLMGPRVLGLFFVQLQFLVNTILASHLLPGSLSALNFAWLTMLLPQGVFAQAVATAAFPTFSAQAAAGQRAALRATFGQTLRAVIFLSVPAAVGLFILRGPLVSLLFERGAFTAQSTAMVAYALQFYAAGLVAHAGLEIVVRAFYASHDTLTPVTVGILAMMANIALSIWWVRRWSYGGLALANSVATTAEFVLLLWLLRRRLGGIDGRRLAWTFLRSTAGALVMGVALAGWLAWLERGPAFATEDGLGGAFLAVLGGIGLAAAVYGLAAFVLRSEELRAMRALVRRRL